MYRVLFLLLIALSACSGDSNSTLAFRHDPVFYFSEAQSVRVNVYYEVGAEPFTGTFNGNNPTLSRWWDLTIVNLQEIFSFKTQSTDVFAPEGISEMIQIDDPNKTIWTVDDLVELASQNNVVSKMGSEAIFSVFFVNGLFEQQGQVLPNVIGVNLSQTSVTVIFKDVINNLPPLLRAFSEQATVIHEIGHALGLVDNGVPLASNHLDSENGAHTVQNECIMYFLNEGAADLYQFIIDFNATGDATLWGPGVLQDVQEFST